MIEAYYDKNRFKLYKNNCIEALETIQEDSVDLIFADPPYNLSNGGFTCHAGRRVSVNKGKWDESRGMEKDFEFHKEWLASCKKVFKPNFFCV